MMYKKRLIFWSACAGMLMFGTSIISLGSIAPDLAGKLNLDEVSSGTLFSILPFGILAGSLLFGPIADRFGYKFLLAISCMLLFGGFEGLALAPSVSIIKIFVFLVGFSGGAINGATNALMADISEKNKGANLSLLGVFFGIGALGMPLALGLFKGIFSFEVIVGSVGFLSFIAGIFYLAIKFPPPKQSQGFPSSDILKILKDNYILLIAFFLFFQSSFEGIINNWTTTYLIGHTALGQSSALIGLSLYVSGMASMRLIIGSFLRSVSEKKILFGSFWLILSGLVILVVGNGIIISYCGLFILGAGLASGFPVMLGLTGNRYAELSGTAFSIVLSIALIGNMSVNYLMGIIAKNFGIQHLTTVALAELIMLALLAAFILKNIKTIK